MEYDHEQALIIAAGIYFVYAMGVVVLQGIFMCGPFNV